MKMKHIAVLSLLAAVLTGCAGNAAKEHPYDYYADCLTQQQVEELAQKPFVEAVFPFSMMIFQRPSAATAMDGQIAYLASWSLENLDVSSFSRTDLVEEDPSILVSPGLNPIIIDSSLAKAEGLSVGDIMYQPTKISQTPMQFTVAAIYRHQPEYAQYEAVILINEQVTDLFADRMEEMGYTNVYIKASDLDGLREYLEMEFVPGLVVKDMPPEETSSFSREDAALYYRDYETNSSLMK